MEGSIVVIAPPPNTWPLAMDNPTWLFGEGNGTIAERQHENPIISVSLMT